MRSATVSRPDLLALYRRERRVLEIANFLREDLGTVVRYSPVRRNADGIVCLTNVSANAVGEEIRRHIAHFQAMDIGFEWKVFDSDEPANLRATLLDAGFAEGEPEVLMAYEAANFRPSDKKATDGIEVRRVDDMDVLEQLVDLQGRIWNRSLAWLLAQLRGAWEHSSFFAAYEQSCLVGTGWIEYPQGSQFAELHGGAVLPNFRRRGVYSRLFESRMIDARERGVNWVAVEAASMSRPILEAKSFEKLDATYPLVWAHRR